jgi:hypothetical protein
MYGYFYLLFALQAFCIYHAYKSRQDQKWYWMIMLFPYVGCLLYLYDAFYSRRTVAHIAEGLKQVVNSNYYVDQLEAAVKFNASTKSRTDLADAYIGAGRNGEAVAIYEECLSGYMADDVPLKMKLLHAYYQNEQFEDCIKTGGQLGGDKEFANANERISLARAYDKVGQIESAAREFEAMDRPFTNFEHRYAYAQHLMSYEGKEAAKVKLTEMRSEIEMMKGLERSTHREAITRINELFRQVTS